MHKKRYFRKYTACAQIEFIVRIATNREGAMAFVGVANDVVWVEGI
jgi:hypothetical protein